MDQDHVDSNDPSLVVQKIDRRLIPLLFTTYMLSFMDKTILSSAAVFGLLEDTVSTTPRHFCTWLTSLAFGWRPV
jgi:hypothetical protein